MRISLCNKTSMRVRYVLLREKAYLQICSKKKSKGLATFCLACFSQPLGKAQYCTTVCERGLPQIVFYFLFPTPMFASVFIFYVAYAWSLCKYNIMNEMIESPRSIRSPLSSQPGHASSLLSASRVGNVAPY